ncbi:uncharacterized protein LOC116920766 [Daphnia magna]|uniref:uncharacterized protein LOC116920766 n=1 Tax=Daphnia magna TaxID=35525 RepID=UPI001E1BBE63|nr:uncharacterized protein LOC116920766 [Daphnia magna]
MPSLKLTQMLPVKKSNKQHHTAAKSEEEEGYSEDESEDEREKEVPFHETTRGEAQEEESRVIDDADGRRLPEDGEGDSGNDDNGELLKEMLNGTVVELARPTFSETSTMAIPLISAEETLVFHITKEELTGNFFYATK